mgnify:CR=1 FL=1
MTFKNNKYLRMKLKKKTFEIPFIGYDYGKDNKWKFDALI